MIPTQFTFFLDPKSCKQRTDPKEYFFSIVACSLLNETKYYEASSQTRDKLIQTMKIVADIDPEFILQVAYYVRNQMYIRSVSNFILAFALWHPKTKPYCSTYMCPTILIPGDLIEVCQFVQVIRYCDKDQKLTNNIDIRKQIQFPKILQKQIKKKLYQFSVYQLGKQCSESNRKKNLKKYLEILNAKNKKQRSKKQQQVFSELERQLKRIDARKQFKRNALRIQKKIKQNIQSHNKQMELLEKKNIFKTNFINFKDIIKFSHVKEPRSTILSLLNEKYPKNEEEFLKLFKNEPNLKFEPEKVGKRMKIPIPVTWDRKLSKNIQSKKEAWESLIEQNQIPYLALLRNLRNILKAGVSDESHQTVLAKISNPHYVKNSKIFPLQYFNALNKLGKCSERPQKKGQGKKCQGKKIPKVEEAFPQELIQQYQAAIEQAIKISVDKNLDTISGVTYVFVDVSGSMRHSISGGRKYGSVCDCMDLAFILAHLIRTKCEQCEFYLFAAPHPETKGPPYLKVEFESDTLLQGIQRCQENAKKLWGSHEMIGQTVQDLLLTPKVNADNIIVLSDMMVTRGFEENEIKMEDVFKNYLQVVNANAKFYFMDISGYGQQVTFGDDLKSKNCIIINGMSDNVLKYIAYAEKLNQVDDIVSFSAELKEKKEQSLLNKKLVEIEVE